MPSGIERRRWKASSAFLIAVFSAFLFDHCNASVAVPSSPNASYPSLPAMFGDPWPQDGDVQVQARLQIVEEWPLMCPDGITANASIVTPSDGLPVALLVSRGECTFFEKAKEAMKLSPTIKYIIIHDNIIDQWLLRMSSDDTLEGVSLLFVSLESGTELRALVSNTTDADGLLVNMDGLAMLERPLAKQLTLTGYLLAALMGFLSFLVFFACILICAQVGLITARTDARGRLILVAGSNGRGMPIVGRILRVEQLTDEQIVLLGEEEFQKDEEVGDDTPVANTAGNNNNNNGTVPATPAAATNDTTDADELEENVDCCSICLDTFEHKQLVITLPCKHQYHKECVVPWLKERQSKCPLCKYDVLEHLLANPAEPQSSSDSGDSRPAARSWHPRRLFRRQQFAPVTQVSNSPPPSTGELEMGETSTIAENADGPPCENTHTNTNTNNTH